jgi:hypothetical protein
MHTRCRWQIEPQGTVKDGLEAAIVFHSSCGGEIWLEEF